MRRQQDLELITVTNEHQRGAAIALSPGRESGGRFRQLLTREASTPTCAI